MTDAQAATSILLALAVLILLLNTPIMLSVVIFRQLRTKQGVCVAGQAAWDVLVAVVSVPTLIFLIHSRVFTLHSPENPSIINDGKYFCIGAFVAVSTPHLGSLMSSIVLTANRYLAVACPFMYVHRDEWEAFLVTAVVSVYSMLWGSLLFVWHEDIPAENGPCTPFVVYPKPYTYVLVSHLVLSMVVPITLNMLIALIVNKVRRKMVACMITSMHSNPGGPDVPKRNTRSWKVSLILYSFFLIFWAPLLIDWATHTANDDSSLGFADVTVCILSTCNSGMNGLECILLKSKFRIAVRTLYTTPPWRWNELSYYRFEKIATSTMFRNKKECEEVPDLYWEIMLNRAVSRYRTFRLLMNSFFGFKVDTSQTRETATEPSPSTDFLTYSSVAACPRNVETRSILSHVSTILQYSRDDFEV